MAAERNVGTSAPMETEKLKWKHHKGESTDAESRAEQLVVAMKSPKRDGGKGLCQGAEFNGPTSNGRSL